MGTKNVQDTRSRLFWKVLDKRKIFSMDIISLTTFISWLIIVNNIQ